MSSTEAINLSRHTPLYQNQQIYEHVTNPVVKSERKRVCEEYSNNVVQQL